MRKMTYTMLCRPCWNNIALEYCLVNVVQICLRQHCTRKLLAQCWLEAHRHTLAEQPVVSNMSGSLVLTGYYITEQSWLFLFNVGLGVHYGLRDNNEKRPTLTGTNPLDFMCCADFAVCY